MKFLILLTLIALTACSHMPEREPASFSEIIVLGEIDKFKSVVTLFPPEIKGDIYRYFFYLQLKNSEGQFVDCDERDVVLKNKKGKKIPFRLERVLPGKYYVIIEKSAKVITSDLDISVQGKVLREQFKLTLNHPDKKNSKIKIISEENHRVTFELTLADSNGKRVNLFEKPEIVFNDGNVSMENLHQVKEGVWRFTLLLSEQNHVIYISVKTNGAYLERLYRLHYVDKFSHGSTW